MAKLRALTLKTRGREFDPGLHQSFECDLIPRYRLRKTKSYSWDEYTGIIQKIFSSKYLVQRRMVLVVFFILF